MENILLSARNPIFGRMLGNNPHIFSRILALVIWCDVYLVRLWGTCRVCFCRRRHRRRRRREETNPIGMYDCSNGSSQCTEQGSVKRFDVLSKIFILWLNSVFLRSRTRDGTDSEIFQKVLVRFQQTRSQMKAYYYCFLF